MRKITQEAVKAFESSGNCHNNNTKVITENGVTSFYLFNNKIAERKDGVLMITNAGYRNVTTKDRLNSLPNVSICQLKGDWFLNGQIWNGDWIAIK